MFHCNGWCHPWAITAAGGTQVCLRAVRGDAIWRLIDEEGVTHLCGAPAVLSMLVNAPEAHPLERGLVVMTAAAPPSPTVLAQTEALGARVVHVYGLTETYGPHTVCQWQVGWDEEEPGGARAPALAPGRGDGDGRPDPGGRRGRRATCPGTARPWGRS